MAEAFAAGRDDVFLPRQFSNEDNSDAHYRTTDPEIWLQLTASGIRPDAFVAGVGTGGTLMGVGRYLRSVAPRVHVYAVEPAESPTLSTGHKVASGMNPQGCQVFSFKQPSQEELSHDFMWRCSKRLPDVWAQDSARRNRRLRGSSSHRFSSRQV